MLGGGVSVAQCRSRTLLPSRIARDRPAVLVVGLFDAKGIPTIPLLHRIAPVLDAVRVVLLCPTSSPRGSFGAAHRVTSIPGASIAFDVAAAVDAVRGSLPPRMGGARVALLLASPNDPAYALLEACAEVLDAAPGPPTVTDVALRMGRGRRAVAVLCRRLGLAEPRVVLELVRLARATLVLQVGSHALRHAPRAAGFGTLDALDALFQHHLGWSAETVAADPERTMSALRLALRSRSLVSP